MTIIRRILFILFLPAGCVGVLSNLNLNPPIDQMRCFNYGSETMAIAPGTWELECDCGVWTMFDGDKKSQDFCKMAGITGRPMGAARVRFTVEEPRNVRCIQVQGSLGQCSLFRGE